MNPSRFKIISPDDLADYRDQAGVMAEASRPEFMLHDAVANENQHVEVANASTNVHEQCAAGVNVATLPWCLREWKPGYRVLVVEFTAADIAAIPTATDGKFRLHRCTVVGEKQIDPVALGLVEAPKGAA